MFFWIHDSKTQCQNIFETQISGSLPDLQDQKLLTIRPSNARNKGLLLVLFYQTFFIRITNSRAYPFFPSELFAMEVKVQFNETTKMQ